MAIKVGGTTVIDNSRNISNVGTFNSLTYPSSDGTTGQFLKTDGSGTLSFQTVQSDPTLGTLTKSFGSGESATITLTTSVSPTAVIAVTKEVSQTGISSKGTWDVNATASNYELHNTAASTTLTPTTIGYGSLAVASYTNKNVTLSTDMEGMFVRDDGLKMYITEKDTGELYEYTLSTAHDITTATYVQGKNVRAFSGINFPYDVHFKPDGTKCFIASTGSTTPSSRNIAALNLSTAWDVSTATLDKLFSTGSDNIVDVHFKPDGGKFYYINYSGGTITEFALNNGGTAWDLDDYTATGATAAGADTTPGCVEFSSDGTRMYHCGQGANQNINVHVLSTAWDLSTATRQTSEDINILSQTGQYNYGLAFSNNGTNMYVLGNSSKNKVYQYSIPQVTKVLLGSGSFASTDIGKTITGNGGEVVLKTTGGEYAEVTPFTDSSTIASGSWSISGIASGGDATGLKLSNFFSGFASPNQWTYDSVSLNTENLSSPTFGSEAHDLFFKPDGTKFYTCNAQQNELYENTLSTPYDLSTATQSANINFNPSGETNPNGIFFKPDGTKMFVAARSAYIYQYDLTTAWDLSTATLTNNDSRDYEDMSGHSYSFGLFFKEDGSKFYVCSTSQDVVREFNLSTAWDINTLSSSTSYEFTPQSGVGTRGVFITPDGARGYVTMNDDKVKEFEMSTAWDIQTASLTTNEFSTSSQDGDITGIYSNNDGSKMYLLDAGAGGMIYQYSIGEIFSATDAYHVGVTNSGGRIDSAFWTDINSMTADEAANSGTVHYAVSTDARTIWNVASASSGVRQIVRNNSGTWQYNSTTGNPDAWDVSEATYVQDHNPTPNDEPQAVFFKPDGTRLYTLERDNRRVYQHALTTAWDISTTQSFDDIFDISSQETDPTGMFFKPDGTKMYIVGHSNDTVYEYDLSTAWDTSTASYNSVNKNTAISAPTSLFFKPDGTKFYTINNNNYVYSFAMSTAWDITSAASGTLSSNVTSGTSPTENNFRGLFFKSDGTKMYLCGVNAKKVFEYNLSTAWDVSTASISSNTILVSGSPQRLTGLFFDADGERLYVVTENNDRIRQYSIGTYAFSTSATWVNGTINNEFYTLQEALNLSRANRMDKTQLDAVADDYHFASGSSLDLMIALRLDTSVATVPTSDGVSINYNAAALNQGAILGTDYNYDIPANNKVRITSTAAQNLKVRVV